MGRARGTSAYAVASATAAARRAPGRFTSAAQAVAFLGQHPGRLLRDLGHHHPYTARHSLQVANLAAVCAARMELDAAGTDELLRVALLHDVGKAEVPVDVLDSGKEPLTDEQWACLRAHADAGARLISQAGAPPVIVRGVRAVHERIDGGGYPDRLAGEQIPLSARIVAVCDAYDAMTTSERQYQDALSSDQALAVLRADAGHFDPRVVEAFVSSLPASVR